jgi:transposase InsO family protein
MDRRAEFVRAVGSDMFTMTELCDLYDISRKTGYKWLNRFEEGGIAELSDRSRAPLHCPHRTPEAIRDAICELRRQRPKEGPITLLERLRVKRPEFADQLPAPSTAGDILRNASLVKPRRRKEKRQYVATQPIVAADPNAVWSADFKGEFKTRDGAWCYPLTVSDACTRYLLLCRAMGSTEHSGAKGAFERLFSEVGLPMAIRTDNGCPFSSVAICGISRLSLYWMKLGIVHQRITPGQPQQNGRHERMHRTLKECTALPPAENHRRQQERFDAFRHDYNTERPHQALEMKRPGSLWRPSNRSMPARLPKPEYEGHMEVRRVSANGTIKFMNRERFLTEVLAGELVALEEVKDGIWSIHFYRTLLARLNIRSGKLIPAQPKTGNEVLPMYPV